MEIKHSIAAIFYARQKDDDSEDNKLMAGINQTVSA